MAPSLYSWSRCLPSYVRWSKRRYLVGVALLALCTWIFSGARESINIEFFPNQFWHTENLIIHPEHLQHQHIKKVIRSNFTPHNVTPEQQEKPIIISWYDLDGIQERDIKCKSFECHVTKNHDVWHKHELLAIIFYGARFGYNGLPVPRKPGHLWGVLQEETLQSNNWLFCAQDAMTLFNLTATFKRESHYPFPTMWLSDEKTLTSTEYVVPLAKKNQLRKNGLAPIVFIHSNCKTPSDRSHYMRLLQQYIQIDSYGRCEHNKDFPKINLAFTYKKSMAPMSSKVLYKIIAQYKFAFAFENAVCDDYITEKFWRPLHLGVVPLVFGSSKIKDFAPSNHSIIDIRDFRSVKEVADYITFLDTHDDEYSKYLDFKRTGITNPKLKLHLEHRDYGSGKLYDSYRSGFECFVCEKLHELRKHIVSEEQTEQWRGRHDHYGCPKPKSFDENGNYAVEDTRWTEPYSNANYYLQSLRHFIDNDINASIGVIRNFAYDLQIKSKSKNPS